MNTCTAGSRTIVLEDYAENDLVRIAGKSNRRYLDHRRCCLDSGKKSPPNTNSFCYGFKSAIGEKYSCQYHRRQHDHSSRTLHESVQKITGEQVGVIFSPKRSGGYVKRARQAAERTGVELVMREVRNPRQTISNWPP